MKLKSSATCNKNLVKAIQRFLKFMSSNVETSLSSKGAFIITRQNTQYYKLKKK